MTLFVWSFSFELSWNTIRKFSTQYIVIWFTFWVNYIIYCKRNYMQTILYNATSKSKFWDWSVSDKFGYPLTLSFSASKFSCTRWNFERIECSVSWLEFFNWITKFWHRLCRRRISSTDYSKRFINRFTVFVIFFICCVTTFITVMKWQT